MKIAYSRDVATALHAKENIDSHLSPNLVDILLQQLERIIIDKVLLFRPHVVVRVLAGLAGAESLRRLRHVFRLTV